MFPKSVASFIPLSNVCYASGYLPLCELVPEVSRKALWPVSLIVLGAPCFHLPHLDRVNVLLDLTLALSFVTQDPSCRLS
jgi:hypothetical protein